MTVDDLTTSSLDLTTVPPVWRYDAAPPVRPPDDWPAVEPQPRRRPGRTTAVVVALALVAAGSAAGGAQWALSRQPATTTGAAVASSPVAALDGTTAPTELLSQVAAAVQPSVVSISVRGRTGSGEGSGVVLRSDGVVVTNHHVVEGATSITVKLSDGSSHAATLLGDDPTVDLAVLKVSGVSGLTPVTLGSSADVHVGDAVLALGSPLGLDGSVSAGIVSALHRTVGVGSSALGDAVQTDAAINPGNSGGPLVDVEGHLVGITTAIATTSSTSGSIGLGLAIPVDLVRSVTDQLIAGQTPKHALLGVQSGDATSSTGTAAGAAVSAVTAGGAAAQGGLRAGDVITAVGAIPVEDATELAAAIRSHQPGERVTVTYVRDGATRTATVVLGTA